MVLKYREPLLIVEVVFAEFGQRRDIPTACVS